MTTDEFIQAAKSAASPEYYAISSLANKDSEFKEEFDRTFNIIRQHHKDGASLVDHTMEVLMGGLDPLCSFPAQTDEEEIEAAAQLLRNVASQPLAVAAYHRQLPRDEAVMICNGALCIAKQGAAIALHEAGMIHAYPGYSKYPKEFAEDWNKANPDELSIEAPIPDYI